MEVLNRIGFLIESNLLKGDIFWDPQKKNLKDDASVYLGQQLMLAAQYEGAGIISLIHGDIENSEFYFNEFYKAYNKYHSS